MTAAPTGVIKDRSHQTTNQPAPHELTSRVLQAWSGVKAYVRASRQTFEPGSGGKLTLGEWVWHLMQF
jgi:hypothetical protein